MVKSIITMAFVALAMAGPSTVFSQSFDPPVNYSTGTGSFPSSVAISDLDGDSDNDIAVTVGTGDVLVLLNNGDGTFAPAVSHAAVNTAVFVFAADLDGDNDNDLAVANGLTVGGSVTILINNGNGTFQTPVSYPTIGWAKSVFCIDFDGDNDNDLAMVGNQDSVSVFLNNGDGTFQTPVNYWIAGSFNKIVISSDFDGDNNNDLAVTNWDTRNVSILMGNGDGTFQTAATYILANWTHSLFSADFDGDGDIDLAVTRNDDRVQILKNNGDGTFSIQAFTNNAFGGATSVFAIDLDGDNDDDLAVAGGTDNVWTFLNSGDAIFSFATFFATSSPGCRPEFVRGGDLDGDNVPDLVVANALTEDVTVLINAGFPTDVEDDDGYPLPSEFFIAQNYPNPFNPSTTISYNLPVRSDIKISIHNVLGREVRSFQKRSMPSGSHLITWDGRDNANNPVASGVYFYRVITEDGALSKKMLLLK